LTTELFFYAVSALFVFEGKTFSKHSAVESAVPRDLVKSGRWSAERGKDYAHLFELRSTGDYGGALHVSDKEATEAVEAARRILQTVQDANPDFVTKSDH
jgi:uncharacterized protein (UPF0332 family)